jgi:hypothetical protein
MQGDRAELALGLVHLIKKCLTAMLSKLEMTTTGGTLHIMSPEMLLCIVDFLPPCEDWHVELSILIVSITGNSKLFISTSDVLRLHVELHHRIRIIICQASAY